jgi:hypothetical protein
MALRESKPRFENEQLLGAREAEAVALASCTRASILLGPGGQVLVLYILILHSYEKLRNVRTRLLNAFEHLNAGFEG